MKILTFIAAFGISIGIAVFLLFILLLALNGFGERDAVWGIYPFVALAFLTAIVTGCLSSFLFDYLVIKKQISKTIAALVAIAGTTAVSLIFNFFCLCLGVIMAEIKRNNF